MVEGRRDAGECWGECCSVAATQVPSARAAHMSVAVSGDFINDLNVVS